MTILVLVQKRPDDAWKIVSKLHGVADETQSTTTSFAREEFYQMSAQVLADERMAANETVMTLFTKPSYRKRMLCAFLTMFGAESTGILVIYSKSLHSVSVEHLSNLALDYSVLLYQGLGFKGSIPLLLAAAYVTVACVGNYVNSVLIDRVGRVNLLCKSCCIRRPGILAI